MSLERSARAAAADGPAATEYEDLVARIAALDLFRSLDRDGSFARELKRLREECRTAIIRRAGDICRRSRRLSSARSCRGAEVKIGGPLVAAASEPEALAWSFDAFSIG